MSQRTGLLRVLGLLIAAAACSRPCRGRAEDVSRSFEFRGVSANPRANGETDFNGNTAVYTTDQRVAFLNVYADYASAWFGNPRLDKLAVSPELAEARVRAMKPQPLPAVRQSLRLEGGWKQAGLSAAKSEPNRPWRTLPGAEVLAGALRLPAGKVDLLDLAQSKGWRFEVSWRAKVDKPGESATFNFGQGKEAAWPLEKGEGWHAYRVQADLEAGRCYLSVDGRRSGDYPLAMETGKPAPLAVASSAGVWIDDLLLMDFERTENVSLPYAPVILADDNFNEKPDLEGWTAVDYNDAGWDDAALPCVRGGIREAGELLLLRRRVELPAARRVWLEVEALDPSGEIWINGQLAAKIHNRQPVLLEVTKQVRTGSNLIAFKVHSRDVPTPHHHAPADKNLGWFAGRATLHLLCGEAAVRELLAYTGSLGEDKAKQEHRITLDNGGEAAFDGTLEIAYRPWFPADGPEVAATRDAVSVPGRSKRQFNVSLEVPRPELWTPEKPALYAVTATLLDVAGKKVDDCVATTGIRTVAQREGLFLLNGEPAMLNGAQIMGFRPVPSVAEIVKYMRCAPAATLMRELLAVKGMNGNVMRVHVHLAMVQPEATGDPRIPEMADQLGLALMWCIPGWIREGDERRIDADNFGKFMRQVYNHPSIVMWEASNHPNWFNHEEGPERTHAFVKRVVNAILADDASRLITPTTHWTHTHYGNDLGTVDKKGRPITPVPEYTHPLVTRGVQDAITGYGSPWPGLRRWPYGLAADCLKNRIRAWFNFEHEESTAQPNWELSAGWPWHRLRSYEANYERGTVGRKLDFSEWRASQAYQAFSAYESMRKQIFHGVSGFSWCTLEGGANSGTYEKPLLDPFGHAKLAWHIHHMVFQPVLAGSDDVDVVYGPEDTIRPCVFNLGPARTADLIVTIKTPEGKVVDSRTFAGLRLEGGRSLLKLPAFRPKLPESGYCVVEYVVRDGNPVPPARGREPAGLLQKPLDTSGRINMPRRDRRSQPDSNRELAFEEFAKEYRCPEWFRNAKFGLWAHWGPQSVPRLGGGWYARHMYMPEVPKGEEFGSQAYPFHLKTYGHPSEFGFKDVINLWKAEKFDADALAEQFKKWGAKFVVGLANHHDHFDCFASTHHPWNSVNMGPKRDIIGEWRKAATRHGLPLGVTVHDNRHWAWWLGAFGSDPSGPKKGVPYDGRLTKADGKGKWWEGYDPADLYGPPPEKRTPELERRMQESWEKRHIELVEKYQPDILYFDGFDFYGMPGAYGGHGKRVVERLYNNSLRRHGSLQAVCLIKSDRSPGWVQDFERGGSDKLEPKPWITDTTLGSDWFYKENRPLVHNARTIIEILADVVSKNGGLLLNVELYSDGSVPAPQRVILEDVGAWLRTHGEAIYETRPWKVFGQVSRDRKATPGAGHFNERTSASPPYAPEEVRFTTRGRSLYAIVLNPRPGRLLIRPLGLDADTKPGRVSRVVMLGHRAEIPFQQSADGLAVTLPDKRPTSYAAALKIEGVIP